MKDFEIFKEEHFLNPPGPGKPQPWSAKWYAEYTNRIINEKMDTAYCGNSSGKDRFPQALSLIKKSLDDCEIIFLTRPIEEEKVECANYWHLLVKVIDEIGNPYTHSLLKHEECPSCGKELSRKPC